MFCSKCGGEVSYGVTYCPHCGAPQVKVKRRGLTSWMVDGVEGAIGSGVKVNLTFGHFFSEVRRRHTKEEAEEIFIFGTPATTPSLELAGRAWRRPWLYSRILLVMLLSMLGLLAVWIIFQNLYMLPGIILLGSFAVPFATLVFFYEMNVPRNISFLEMLEDFFMGGVASILAVHPLLIFFPSSGAGSLIPAMLTGIIEEVGKLIIIAFVINRSNEGRYILNGLLFGAAVGAGFASFESAGYAFGILLEEGSDLAMMVNIILRGLLSIGGHVAWSAVTGAALSIALDRGKFTFKVFGRAKFWGLFLIPVVFHGLWDWLTLLLCIPLVIAIWIVLLVLIRRGFAEINALAANTPRE